jgi:hypothetical protein
MALKCLNPKYKGCRALRSAWMIALMGLLRTSEFLVENPRKPNKMRLLCVRDVKWFPDKKNPKWIKIHIRASKTDFWRKGVFIVIGITNCPEFCAVTELRLALEQRFEDRKEWDQKAPLFLIHGHPLSKQRSSGMLKLITEKLGWNPRVYESILRRTGFAHKLFLSKRRCFFNSIEGTTDCLEDHRSLEIGCVQVRPFSTITHSSHASSRCTEMLLAVGRIMLLYQKVILHPSPQHGCRKDPGRKPWGGPRSRARRAHF